MGAEDGGGGTRRWLFRPPTQYYTEKKGNVKGY